MKEVCRWCKAELPSRAKGQWKSNHLKERARAHRETCPIGKAERRQLEQKRRKPWG